MHRYVHRTGVGVIGWRQASGAAVAATLAPRDNHRRVVSRGRVVRSAGGYGVVAGGATASASITTADSTFAGSAAVSPIAAAAVTTAGSVFAGSAAVGTSVAAMFATTEDAFCAAVASVSPVALMAGNTANSTMVGIAVGEPIDYVPGAIVGNRSRLGGSRPSRIATTTR